MFDRSALVVLSGGQDSTTCLYWARQRFDRVCAVTFDYGQRHRAEIDAAIRIARMANVAMHEVIECPVLASTSPLVDPHKPPEQYESAEALPGGIEKTFVPMRNTLFLTIAANRAIAWECGTIVTGVSQEDYGGYPDCREPFIKWLEGTINCSLDGVRRLSIATPLMHLDKAATVEMALAMRGCMTALAYSHTCYTGSVPPCGKCHACLLRARGFAVAGTPDPLVQRVGSAA